ncbi:hypothetical protein [Marinilactibacillus piezotolerans]|uniref:hypothetical protein n=1 Tax=Marinilactibacillus piezotolerans TaxID=258723 RepID=UPI0009B06E5F|nr:hypothetical protein [Marinilactibacillus piezotolerans]
MHLKFSAEDKRDIEALVKQLDISKETYVLNLHKKNAMTREALKDNEQFRGFVEDYHRMLDNLYDNNQALKDMIENNDDAEVIDAILNFLETTVRDPMFLTQLYGIYKKQNS